LVSRKNSQFGDGPVGYLYQIFFNYVVTIMEDSSDAEEALYEEEAGNIGYNTLCKSLDIVSETQIRWMRQLKA